MLVTWWWFIYKTITLPGCWLHTFLFKDFWQKFFAVQDPWATSLRLFSTIVKLTWPGDSYCMFMMLCYVPRHISLDTREKMKQWLSNKPSISTKTRLIYSWCNMVSKAYCSSKQIISEEDGVEIMLYEFYQTEICLSRSFANNCCMVPMHANANVWWRSEE